MKYRLKKDLPFAKAGEIVDVNDDTDIWTVRPLNAKIDCPLCDIPEDARDEWIEEVKPREWWISKTVLTDFANEDEEKIYAFETRKDLIKIREVIE